MSTILDALRKVEEEARTQNTDARTRLLSANPRFDFRTPRRQKMPLALAAVLILAGIAIGASVFVLGGGGNSSPQVALTGTAKSSPTVAEPAPATPSQQQSLNKKSPPPATKVAQSEHSPAAPTTPSSRSAIVSSSPQEYSPWRVGNESSPPTSAPSSQPPPTESLVQKSPFVTNPPHDQIAAPAIERGASASAIERGASTPPTLSRRPAPVVKPAQPQALPGEDALPTVAANTLTDESAMIEPSTVEENSAPPDTSLTFLQWSAEPDKRIASIKVGSGPSTLAHEGDSIGNLTIVEIRPDAVKLRSGSSHYVLKAR